MKIHLHTILWNEEQLIPFFLHFYEPICDKIFVYDNGSTDNSLQKLKKYPKVEVQDWQPNCESICLKASEFKSQFCKLSSDADWVLIVDPDEFLYLKNLREYLCALDDSIKAIKTTAYCMIHDEFPLYNGKCLTELAQKGVRDYFFDKVALLRPNVGDFQYSPGCHQIAFKNPTLLDETSNIKLLHYRLLGKEHTHKRYQELAKKLKPKDIWSRYGQQYFIKENDFNLNFDKMLNSAQNVF